ncbi:MAG: response regulator transcription factor [Leptospira sp.]|nr:response regulator transcription factor [Leptospira sp.]NCS92997.1 response regulator transcription factor [Leptospira sp.]
MKKVLIVDDNDRYADNLKAYYSKLGYECSRAYDAREGWNLYSKSKSNADGSSDFDTIVTDITMETQTSGLWMIRRIHKDGFSGTKIIATTGFDVFGVMGVSKFILPWFAGISFMIPKVPLKKGEVVLVPIQS